MRLDKKTREWLGLGPGEEYEDGFSYNPLEEYCERISPFVSKSHGRIKTGPRRGQQRLRRCWIEVEFLVKKPSGKTIAIKDHPVKGLDSLAEEALDGLQVPPHLTPYQHFLNLFRQLPPKNGKKKAKGNKKKKRA